MKILAVDTATENCSAALLIDGTLQAREQLLLHRGAAERILPMVHELLGAAAVRLADLDAIAFGRGPGGFTGARLAASITQGLAFACGLRVVPISNLRALAQRALEAAAAQHVLVCSDARMQEVYWACFARDEAGARLVGEERVGAADTVALPAHWIQADTIAAGTGFAAYPALGTRLAPRIGALEAGLLPRAHEIAALAVAEVTAGRLLDPAEAVPLYLRNNVARVAPSH